MAANKRPLAGDDKFTTRPDPLHGNVLGNDFDLDGDSLSVTPIDAPVVNGHLVGVDSFEYVPADRFGADDVGKVTIGVGVPA